MIDGAKTTPAGRLPPPLAQASAILGARYGLRFDTSNRDILEMGLRRAAHAAGDASLDELIERLESGRDPPLVHLILQHVTIGETYFFRHPEDFAVLRQHIVSELPHARSTTQPICVWSAGCASGEEAYSLAITLATHPDAHPASVLGTDLNRTALETARAASYGRWSLRGNARERYPQLLPYSDDKALVSAAIRARVRFEYLNLSEPVYPSAVMGTDALDLILCRNVLVYLLPHVARAVLQRMRDCLVDGGYLLVSALDLDYAPEGLERVHHGHVLLLRKPCRVLVAAPARPTLDTTRLPLPLPSPPKAKAKAWPVDPDTGVEHLVAQARAEADRGELEGAVARLRAALTVARHPQALHLLALVLSERGERAEVLQLLDEVVERAPDYVLGHLSCGLMADAGARRERHLRRVLALVAQRRDDEMLPGPEPLPVAWVRNLANVGLS